MSSPLHNIFHYKISSNRNLMYYPPYCAYNVFSTSFTYSVSFHIFRCFLLPFTQPGDLDYLMFSGVESERSPWPLTTCSALQQTSPTSWRSHRRRCTLHSPSSWKTSPKFIAKAVRKRRELCQYATWERCLVSHVWPKMREINLLAILYF